MCCICDLNERLAAPTGRRAALRAIAGAAVATAAVATGHAQPMPEFRRQVMRLAIVNRSSGEAFDGVFWHHGTYNIGAVNQLNMVLRDQRAGAVVQIELPLLDLVERIYARVRRPLAVVSAYRTYETNRALRRADSQVAENSFHIRGQATDFGVDGVGAARLARIARQAGAGGVGVYSGSNFIHVDTGPRREWAY